jgi:hypothetical protein
MTENKLCMFERKLLEQAIKRFRHMLNCLRFPNENKQILDGGGGGVRLCRILR